MFGIRNHRVLVVNLATCLLPAETCCKAASSSLSLHISTRVGADLSSVGQIDDRWR